MLFQIPEQALILDEPPLAVRYLDPHIVPVRLWNRVPPGRTEHDCRIEVHDQHAPRAFGGAVDRDNAVDVLRRCPHEVYALGPAERGGELSLRSLSEANPSVVPVRPIIVPSIINTSTSAGGFATCASNSRDFRPCARKSPEWKTRLPSASRSSE